MQSDIVNHVFMGIIAVHCMISATLFWLIHLQLPEIRSVKSWSLSNFVFGLAFGAILLSNFSSPAWQGMSESCFIFGGALLLHGCIELVHFESRETMATIRRILISVAVGSVLASQWLLFLNDGWAATLVVAYLVAIYLISAAQFFSRSAKWIDARIMRAPTRTAGLILIFVALITALRLIDVTIADGSPYTTWYATIYYGCTAAVTFFGGYCLIWISFSLIRLELSQMASTDVLTGILNRRGLKRALTRHFDPKAQASMVFLQVDIDHFKKINDHHGHDAGDLVLVATAKTLKASVRKNDVVARTGGEEFLIGLSDASGVQAIELAEAIRQRVEQTRIKSHNGMDLQVQVSVGISEPFFDLSDWEIATQQADRALYRAKSNGRNRTERYRAGSDPLLDLSPDKQYVGI